MYLIQIHAEGQVPAGGMVVHTGAEVIAALDEVNDAGPVTMEFTSPGGDEVKTKQIKRCCRVIKLGATLSNKDLKNMRKRVETNRKVILDKLTREEREILGFPDYRGDSTGEDYSET